MKAGAPNQGMAGVHVSDGGAHGSGEEFGEGVAVDGEVDGLADADVVPGAAWESAGFVGPDVRVDVGDEGHSGGLELIEHVGRGGFGPVDLAGEEGGGAGDGLGDGHEDEAVEFGDAGFVPVVRVASEFEAFAGDDAVDAEGAGAGGVEGDFLPVAAVLFPVGGAGIEEIGDLEGEEGVDDLGGDLDGHVVDGAVGGDGGDAAADLAGLAGIVLGGFVVVDFFEVPDDCGGVEGGAVVEFHVGAEFEGPGSGVFGVGGPFEGEAGGEGRGDVGAGEVPVHEGVVDGVAGEAVALHALVGLAGCEGDVGGGHADAEGSLGFCLGG